MRRGRNESAMRNKFKTDNASLNALLFIYNNDSSMVQALKDYTAGTPVFSQTENCPLCAITHTPVGMKKEWKRFIRDLKIPSRFLNRNEFLAEFGNYPITFPVVLLETGPELAILVGSEEISRCSTLSDMISLLMQHLQNAANGIRFTSHSQNIC
jgi:hypothetical protein